MNRGILLRLLAIGLACLIGTAAFAQLPGFEHGLPGDDAIAAAAGDQVSPAVASGQVDGLAAQLAVWADERANPYVYYEYETSSDIYGVRLDAAGVPLDAVPIAISAARGSQSAPQVAWNGSMWLVVFRSTTLGGTGYYYDQSLAAVRLAPDGTVLDDVPIPLHGLAAGQFAVASDGAGWVVAAQGNDTGGDVVALRVNELGEVLDPPTIVLVPQADIYGAGIRLASAGGVYLLTYPTRLGSGAVMFDASLLQLAWPHPLLDGVSVSALAGMARGFYVAWNQQRPDFTQTIMGSRVDLYGTRLDGEGVDLAGSASPQGNVVGLAWDGLDWRVGWTSGGTLQLARVNESGQPANPGGTPVAGAMAGPMAAAGAGGVQIVWSAYASNEYDVFGATVDASDQLRAQGGIATGQPRQNRTDLAAGAAGYMLVYRSAIAGEVAVLAQPLDAAGIATGVPVELDRGATQGGPGSPAVAWNGTYYLVSWDTADGIVAQRMTQGGILVDASPVLVMNPGFGPVDVAALGDDFMVVGREFGFTIEYIFPIGARIRGATGAVLDATPIELGPTASAPFTVFAREPAVTTLAGRWLAAWHTNATHDKSNATTVGVFVDAAGQPGAPFAIGGGLSTSGGNAIHQIALASSGSNALFAMSREITPNVDGVFVENDMELFLIDPDAGVQYLGNATPWFGNQYRPAISFDGRDFIVAFQDQKNRLAPHSLEQLDARSDFYGMRVTTDGTILDPQGFLIDDSPFAQTDLAIASRGSDTLIAGSQMLNDGAASNYRIMLSGVVDGSDRHPVALASASAPSGDVPLGVTFDSTGSFDPEGSALGYLWDFGDHTTSTLPNPSHEFAQPGEYPVRLTVSDATGRSASQAIMIQATAPNALPVAVASASRPSGPTPLSVQLYADGSYDPDGALGNIEWRLSDGRSYYGTPAYFTFSTEGSYTATLRVYDSRGAFGEDSLTIVAGGANQPPIAQAGATPSSGDAPLLVAFSSAGSSDADGSIVSYAWDFGDGTSGSGANPSHSYASLGTFVARLTVTDNSGASASDELTISVNAHSARSLLASIDFSTAKVRGTQTLRGAVTVVNGLGEPQTSVIVNGVWTMPDGSRVNRYQYSDTKGVATFSVSLPADGTYTLEVLNATLAGSLFDPIGSETIDSITLGAADTTPPAQPGGLVAVPGDAQVSLDWADNGEADLAGYHIERADAMAGPFSRLTGATPIAPSQYLDGGLVNGQAYYYRIVAIDGAGNESTPSEVVSAVPSGGGTSPATSLHVAAITLTTANASKGSKFGVATVSVVDNNGMPVGGADVSGQFSGSYSETVSATTGPDGSAVLQTTTAQKGSVAFGFCVTALQHPTLTYVATDNTESCHQF